MELIVEALDGDPEQFHSLWKQLRLKARQVPEGGASETVKAPTHYRFRLAQTEYTRRTVHFLALERARRVKESDGTLAAAQYLEGRIGTGWNSPLVPTYIELLEAAGQDGKIAQLVPHLRGITMLSAEASHAVAEMFDELEEFSEAARHGKAALQGDPNNAKYAWLLGSYLASIGQDDEAHVYYELAHRLNPDDSDFAESYLDSLLARSEFAKAEKAARGCWGNEAIRMYAGIALALQGDFSEAESVLSSISKLPSSGIRALAQVLVALDRSDEALVLLANHWEKFPDDLDSGAMYAELLRDAGATEAFSEALNRLEAGVVRERERTAALMAKIRANRQSR
ncbi:hypothetical protein K5X85_17540 [Streptomyces sp. A144]|uniref:tetratricopeptide repeat protein n=1 Tax=Streptomyces sp. A144 TaxID=2871487 RepID=UPI001CBD7B26|nr:hypothetical protein [Streptomyces sp. A144]UAX54684.1 hypothetical protein K5X85_17540 [Streptomyces sp. A144]